MALLKRFLIVVTLAVVAMLVQVYYNFTAPVPIPDMDIHAYWGPGKALDSKENTKIQPYKINVPKEVIEDLESQLKRPLKYQSPLEGINFEYGFNNDALKNIVTYWRDSYLPKWNQREKFLNQFPQFTTQIQGLNIHFIHVKPVNTKGKTVLPLLLMHGWPGSIREFYDIIPLLTTPNAKSEFVFEVIAPSLVGYGFSQGAAKPGFGALEMAVVMRNLMLRVGHDKFLIQGGDWGSMIGATLSALFPKNTLGYHSNMAVANNWKGFMTLFFPTWLLEKEQLPFYKPFGDWFCNFMLESGYGHIQATKPDTLGVALLNNPVGLAAYILEKFSTWTNAGYIHLPDGGLTQRYTMDSLLDNIMIYYVTNSITTSVRLYSETMNKRTMKSINMPVKVPTGVARFLHDLQHSSDWTLSSKFSNIIHSSYYDDGGHFAAMELPKVLYADFVTFVGKVFNETRAI